MGGCCRIGPARIADLAAECAGPDIWQCINFGRS
ncbi:hypothetical protein ACFV2C_16130 [[Kitasatospora] papulosa]